MNKLGLRMSIIRSFGLPHPTIQRIDLQPVNCFEAIHTITDWQESNISDQLVGKTDGVAINRRRNNRINVKILE